MYGYRQTKQVQSFVCSLLLTDFIVTDTITNKKTGQNLVFLFCLLLLNRFYNKTHHVKFNLFYHKTRYIHAELYLVFFYVILTLITCIFPLNKRKKFKLKTTAALYNNKIQVVGKDTRYLKFILSLV